MTSSPSIVDQLMEHGWYQGGYEGPDGSVCLEKACYLADGWRRSYPRDSDAFAAVREVLLDEHDVPVPSWWNDAPERTFEDVLSVAKEADRRRGL